MFGVPRLRTGAGRGHGCRIVASPGVRSHTTVRRGRQKLHYLNPVPLHAIQDRWIDKFERPRLHALRTIKRRSEHTDGSGTADVVGTVVDADPPQRLVTTCSDPGDSHDDGTSMVTFEVDPHGDMPARRWADARGR